MQADIAARRALLPGIVARDRVLAWLPLLVLIGLGTLVRLPGIGASLWIDELAQVFVARSPLIDLLQGVRTHLDAAPLDYLGTRIAIDTAGPIFPDITLAAHLWPLACGAATVAATWGLTQELTQSRRAAFVAGLLTSLSGFLVFYSQEARFYSMAAMMTVISLWAFARAIQRGGRRDWLVLAAVTVVSVYTHYFIALLLLMEGAALLVVRLGALARRPDRTERLVALRPVAFFVFIGLITVIAFTPWYLFAAGDQLSVHPGYPPVEPLTLDRLASLLATLLAAVPRGGVPTGNLWSDWLLTASVLIFSAIGAFQIVRRRPEAGLAMIGFTIVMIPLVWLMDSLSQYTISERQFIFLIPVWYVMAGAGVDGVLARISESMRHYGVGAERRFIAGAWIALGVILLFASVAPLQRVYAGEFRPKEDWRSAAALTAQVVCPDGRVYSNLPAYIYYGVTLYAPHLDGRTTFLQKNTDDEFLLDVMKRYPITTHDVVVIFTNTAGVFVPGHGDIDVITTALEARKFISASFTDDRIRVLYSPGACAS